MFKLIPSLKAIGLEKSSIGLKAAEVEFSQKKPLIVRLLTLANTGSDVKQLYKQQPILATGLEGQEVLLRTLRLPLTKEKDIEAALPFQTEPLLPYSVDEAFLARHQLNQDSDSTTFTVLAARKESLQAHLDQWKQSKIEPEQVSCVPAALWQFGRQYISAEQTFVIIHLQERAMTCALIKEGKLFASFSHQEGIGQLQAALDLDSASQPLSTIEWSDFGTQASGSLLEAFTRLQRATAKMCYALAKDLKGQNLDGVVVTGEGADWPGFSQALVQGLNQPILPCEVSVDSFSTEEKLRYAVPIGLAIGALLATESIDFRQQDLSYPHPWKRLKAPLTLYFALMLMLSATFYVFGQNYLSYKESTIKQEYLDLLAGMGKVPEQFEETFLTKTPAAREKSQGELVAIADLQQGDLLERLTFLQKDLQATPDSFPLFANTPRVSDVLAWLSQHPAIFYQDAEGKTQARLQLDSFNYTMIKRPMQGKKQEKYQVKIELEFSSSMPKWAREFHDALIAPNDWIDPKGEVKWNSNRGKYKTSFYLKDKTSYPSL